MLRPAHSLQVSSSTVAVVVVHPPAGPVYRVAGTYAGSMGEAPAPTPNPFDPPPWHIPFRGRFDDPSIAKGTPNEQCFRTLYFATQLAGAFGETIQKFIPGPDTLQKIFQGAAPTDPQLLGGIVPSEWLERRWIGGTHLSQALLFVDLTETTCRGYFGHLCV